MASVTDIITLDNFETKMPTWHPSLPNHLYALVDMGSLVYNNGIRFSISDLSPPHARLLKCLYRERAAISLFDALNSSSSNGPLKFPPDTIAQVSETLARFKSIADDYGVPPEQVSVFATEAMRKAENAADMLDAIRATSGLGVHILAPPVEALFGAIGARSTFTDVKGLFLDLGGGSVQMSYVDSAMDGYEIAAAQSGISLPFGAARLIKILDAGGADAEATAKRDLGDGMMGAFAKLKQRFPSLATSETNAESNGIDIYLCGGGFRGYGSVLMHSDAIQPYPIPAVGAYTVSGECFKQTEMMRQINRDYEGKIFGMSKRRRHQFPAIATVVESLIRAVPHIRTVTFCSGGNREGVLLLKLPKDVRRTKPVTLLRQPENMARDAAVQSVVESLLSAIPTAVVPPGISTVFTLGLGEFFVDKIWSRTGESSDANAAFELHQSLTRHPSVPGLTHLARAVLGLTLCARWGSNLGPVDKQLLDSLRDLAYRESPEAVYWAEYIGAVASVIATICPAEPKDSSRLAKSVNFRPRLVNGKHKTKIELTITVSANFARGLETRELGGAFQSLGKVEKNSRTIDRKIDVIVLESTGHE